MAIEKIQAIRGMSDMLPEDAPLWRNFTVISTFVLRSSNRLVCLNAVSAK